MNAKQRVQKLYDLMKDGYTIQISHRNQAIYLTQKEVVKFEAAGIPILAAQGEHICLASGKKYDSLLGWTFKWGK